ncbi:MAG: hypothetical protein HQL63_15095 [Magnetococcales bacterium]|nr:hypothetical protein [Magnetococcales bacterium]
MVTSMEAQCAPTCLHAHADPGAFRPSLSTQFFFNATWKVAHPGKKDSQLHGWMLSSDQTITLEWRFWCGDLALDHEEKA